MADFMMTKCVDCGCGYRAIATGSHVMATTTTLGAIGHANCVWSTSRGHHEEQNHGG